MNILIDLQTTLEAMRSLRTLNFVVGLFIIDLLRHGRATWTG